MIELGNIGGTVRYPFMMPLLQVERLLDGETGEGGALPSHKVLNLLAERKALAISCGRM